MAVKKWDKYKNYFKKYKSVPSVLKYGKRSARNIDISICIPTYNRLDLLEECIRSCLKQKPCNLSVEIIVVDNNSEADNDNLKLLQRIDSKKVCYYQNGANLGMFGNWNRCIELAKGKWVSILHDDDLLAPDCFRLWEELLASPKLTSRTAYIKTPAIYFYQLEDLAKKNKIDRFRERYGTRFYYVKAFDLVVNGVPGRYGAPTCGTLLKRNAVLKTGGYNTEQFYPSEDAFFPVRLFERGYDIASTIAPFGYYRWMVNATMRRETHIAFVQDMVAYRRQAKRFGKRYEIYGHYFEDAQLYFFCQRTLKQFVQPCDYEGYFDEVAEVRRIKVKKIRFLLYKNISRIQSYLLFVRALF